MILAAGLLCAGISAAQQANIEALPARDTHEGLTIAADPYTDPNRSKERFGKKHPYQAGLLAVEVLIRNDNSQPVRVALEQIRLVLDTSSGPKQRLAPMPFDETILALLQKRPETARRPLPGRLPTSPRGKDWDKMEALLRPLWFEMEVIPPGATARGFLFFDMQGKFDWLAGASLYFPEVYFVRDGKPLLFFEVPLRPDGTATRRPHHSSAQRPARCNGTTEHGALAFAEQTRVG
jgi:hypothetical protein